MKISPEVKQLAAETAAKLGVDVLHVNDKGEFFTDVSLARNSVANDTTRLAKLNFQAEVEEEAAQPETPIVEETIKVLKTPAPVPEGPYAKMELKDLQALCKERGIPYVAAAKEANLIGKLEAWDKAQEEAANDPEEDFVITEAYFADNKEALEADGKQVGDTIKLKKSQVPAA